MVPELEKQLNVTFPSTETFHTEEFRQFLDDLCVKNNVDCSHPRTSARLLDKVRNKRRSCSLFLFASWLEIILKLTVSIQLSLWSTPRSWVHWQNGMFITASDACCYKLPPFALLPPFFHLPFSSFLSSSPLSLFLSRHRSVPGLTERFELFVCQKEICNAYTELNDPVVQRSTFEQQAKVRSHNPLCCMMKP